MTVTKIKESQLASISSLLDTISSTQGAILYRGASNWAALGAGAAGQSLKSNGAGANPSWGNDWDTTIIKSADESRTSTAVNANDSELLFPVVANSWYEYEMLLLITGTAGLGGMRTGFTVPSGADFIIMGRNTANTTFFNTANTAFIAAATTLASQIAVIWGYVKVDSTAGNVNFLWAQNTSNAAAVTIKAGSKLRYRLS